MKKKMLAGTTSHIERVFLQDSSQTDGRGLTGLAYNTSGLTVYYSRQGDSGATVINLVTATVGTWVSGGFVQIDATNMPGWYELHVPNAVVASGAKSVGIHLKGATNMAPYPLEIELDAVNYQSAAGFMAGVNSLAPPSNWNLMAIDGSGRIDLGKWLGSAPDALSSGKLPADVKLWLASAPDALSSGKVAADLKLWLAAAPLALSAQQVQAIVSAYATGQDPATLLLATPANKLATDSSGRVTVGSLAAAAIAAIQSGLSTLTAQGVWEYASRTLSAFGFSVTAATVSDKTGYSLDSAQRVKLDSSQPDYAPLKSTDYTAPNNSGISTAASAAAAAALAAGSAQSAAEAAQAAAEALPSAADNADAVWDEALSGHTTAGTAGKSLSDASAAGNPWEAPVRTLTMSAAQIREVTAGSDLVIRQGDTWEQPITGLGSLVGRTALYFTVKRQLSDTDARALLQIEEGEGLLRINQAAPASPVVAGDASITVDDESAGDVTLRIEARAAAALLAEDGTFAYDIKAVFASDVNTKTEGNATITAAVTRAIAAP